MTTSPASNDTSPLLSLPAELRNVIYTLVLQQTEDITITRQPHTEKLWMFQPQRTVHFLALAGVSRAARGEALPLFYGLITFRIMSFVTGKGLRMEGLFRDDMTLLGLWMHRIICAGVTQVACLRMEIGSWFMYYHRPDEWVERVRKIMKAAFPERWYEFVKKFELVANSFNHVRGDGQ